MSGSLAAIGPAPLRELTPLVRRVASLDPRTVVRLRVVVPPDTANGAGTATAAALARLPFGVLVARTVRVATYDELDVVVTSNELCDWLDGAATQPPASREHDWRSGLPPTRGWQRLESVPDDVVRPLVRQGALTLRDIARREGVDGVAGAQPRAEVSDALLDTTVLTVAAPGADRQRDAAVTLRALSALTRMGFLTRGGQAHVDVAGRWIRVGGEYGAVYLERPGAALTLH